MWRSELPQDYERVDEYSDATPNGWAKRVYRFTGGTTRTFVKEAGASRWRETTPPRDLSPTFIEPSADPDVDT